MCQRLKIIYYNPCGNIACLRTNKHSVTKEVFVPGQGHVLSVDVRGNWSRCPAWVRHEPRETVFNPAVSSEARCPHAHWFHHFHCEKVCDACIQEPNNAEAANIGFPCQQWGNHRVTVPLEYMPAHLRSALSRKTRVDSNGYLVGDTFSTNAQASSSSMRLREKTEEVNRMYGSLMLLPPNAPYPQIIGLERKDHYFTHPFDAVGLGGRIRDSNDLWSRVSPYGSIGAEMDVYRQAQFTLPPTPEILGQISGSVQAAIRASEARGGRGEMRAPNSVPRPSMSQEEIYARGLADSWVQKRNEGNQ
ncbi:uncharacterized protein CCOS01_12715 [Colletotrichum costaricense]|uniref:Uncharacterized protein n=1 Tax=Colletotrichum costaricense TaxID=1209916 RepID=A0AAI9YN45_9PEZI|nr:uncharacterized protein CCOS01_12715 [Colletotrichum costaricense]KAK1517166.1 hypothetical protein CCOS01_12715 [Colletotrichum costaricense]